MQNKGLAFLTMSDAGIKAKNQVFTWTADTFGEWAQRGARREPRRRCRRWLSLVYSFPAADPSFHLFCAGLGSLVWQKIVLVSTLLPGTPEILTLAPSFQPDFPNGNFTLNEVPNAMAAAGLTMANLGDNST